MPRFKPYSYEQLRFISVDLKNQQRLSGKVEVDEIYSYTHYAAPAHISSLASIEAFLNEITFTLSRGCYSRIPYLADLIKKGAAH
jgi:hypothetical protein